MIFLLILGFIALVLFEVPGLIRKKYWRELVAYSVILSLAFFVFLMMTLKIDIPNPVKETQYWVKGLIHLSYD